MVKGILRIMFLSERVFLENKTKDRVLFEKKDYKGKGPLIEWEERGGLNAKRPFIPFLPSQNRGGGPACRRRPIRPLRAPGVALDRGKGKGGYGEPIPGLTSS